LANRGVEQHVAHPRDALEAVQRTGVSVLAGLVDAGGPAPPLGSGLGPTIGPITGGRLSGFKQHVG